MSYYEKNDGLEESEARGIFLLRSFAFPCSLFCYSELALARAMTASVICSCVCFVVLDSIAVAIRTVLMRTVVTVRCKRERKKNVVDVRSFVLTAIHTHTHVCTRLSLLPTPPLHSYVAESRKKRMKEGRRKKNERKEGCRGKEGGLSFVRFVVFVRSVSCPVLYCAVALGATATRSIVIALPFSHHQQAIAEIASKRERERETRPRMCVARQQ